MNKKGQWIILSGMILAIGLVFLVILLNQAMSAGYRVSVAETDFQSREITEIFEETVRTGWLVWTANPNETQFETNMSNFNDNMSQIYATRGVLVEINTTMNASTNIMNMSMHYYDGKLNFTLGTTTEPRHIILPVTI
ncbi:MAG TPA: hypothetical protein VMW40_02800 [Candidatus Bathyarchaeia archaeon]|nr:hypothetical protein [Candidatus Bathyarchaeia archaeon]